MTYSLKLRSQSYSLVLFILTCKNKETFERILAWVNKGRIKHLESDFKKVNWEFEFYNLGDLDYEQTNDIEYLLAIRSKTNLSLQIVWRLIIFVLFWKIRKNYTITNISAKELFLAYEENIKCHKKEF